MTIDASTMDIDGGADAATDPDAGPIEEDAAMSGTCDPRHVLFTLSDFMEGGLARLELPADGDPTLTVSTEVGDQDSIPALAGCTPIVLERGAGRILLKDSDDPLTTVGTIALDEGSAEPYSVNPTAVAALGEDPSEAYVVAAAKNEVAIIELGAEAASTGAVDLSALAHPLDTDGVVDATDVIVIGDRAYVALGRYYFDADFEIQFDAGSVLAVIDTTTHAAVDVDPELDGVQGIELTGDNPWRGLAVMPGDSSRLLVGTAGSSFALDGGIEIVDLESNESVGYALREADIDAELEGFWPVSSSRVLVLAGGSLYEWNPDTDGPPAKVLDAVGMAFVAAHHVVTWSGPDLRVFDLDSLTERTPSTGFAAPELPFYAASRAP